MSKILKLLVTKQGYRTEQYRITIDIEQPHKFTIERADFIGWDIPVEVTTACEQADHKKTIEMLKLYGYDVEASTLEL